MVVFLMVGVKLNGRCRGFWTTTCTSGESALGAAIDAEEPAILRLLLKYGADPDIVNTAGNTPAMIAVEMSDADSVRQRG